MATRKNETLINEQLSISDTIVNSAVQSDDTSFTEVNPTVQNYTVDIPAGTLLAGKYRVETPLSTNTGEANLYLCKYRNNTYVAKVYRRQSAIKDDIVLALEGVSSPHVAKLFETGTYNNAPFEILPYYKYGSLEGKTFSFERLRKEIIPALNDGLLALHKKNIIHKDLKPSNIMLCDDQKGVAIIDFGISSIREGGNTVVVTKTGMTPEYSAPETFRNLFLEESDYYSLGVTLYELYCGHTPYSGVSKDVIEQYIAVQKIPFPAAFPEELKRLITGLTYNDITNRKDKNNPNRRWTYEEVKSWCKGEYIPLPGGEINTAASTSTVMPSFTFQYKKYTRVGELAEALGNDWANGKKRLYRSLLTDHFRTVDQEIASSCMDAEEAVRKDKTRADIEFFTVLYKMYPQMKSFHWIDYHYPNMEDLGIALLAGLRKADVPTLDMADAFIVNRLFSIREKCVGINDKNRHKNIYAIESKYLLAKQYGDKRTQFEQLFVLGYYYSCTKDLVTSFGSFNSVEALIAYVKEVIKDNPDKLDALSKELIYHEKRTYNYAEAGKRGGAADLAAPQFAGWLYAHGKTSVLPG